MIDFYLLNDKDNNNDIIWLGTIIYGYPITNHKILTCKLINNLVQRNPNTKWLIFWGLKLGF